MQEINTWQKMVAHLLKRKQTAVNEMLWLTGERKMGQARTLNEKELKLLLLYVQTRKHAARDRAMVLMTYWAGMRIGEVAAVKIGDVLAADGSIKEELRLRAELSLSKGLKEGETIAKTRYERRVVTIVAMRHYKRAEQFIKAAATTKFPQS